MRRVSDRRGSLEKYEFHVLMLLIAVIFGLAVFKYYDGVADPAYFKTGTYVLKTALAIGNQYDGGNTDISTGFQYVNGNITSNLSIADGKVRSRGSDMNLDRTLPFKGIDIPDISWNTSEVYVTSVSNKVSISPSKPPYIPLLSGCVASPGKPVLVTHTLGSMDNKDTTELFSYTLARELGPIDTIQRFDYAAPISAQQKTQLTQSEADFVVIVDHYDFHAPLAVIYAKDDASLPYACQIQHAAAIAGFEGISVQVLDPGLYEHHEKMQALYATSLPGIYLNVNGAFDKAGFARAWAQEASS